MSNINDDDDADFQFFKVFIRCIDVTVKVKDKLLAFEMRCYRTVGLLKVQQKTKVKVKGKWIYIALFL